MRTAILASGRGSNMQAIIECWQNGGLPINIVAVGSDNPQALALAKAQNAGIPTLSFPKEEYADRELQGKAINDWLKEYNAELLLLAGFMKVLGTAFLREANIPVLNIHPSLLPAFPGLHAQRQAVEYGVKVSGCTVHFVDEGLDSGPIILQEAVPVLPDDTEDSLSARILQVEHRLYPEAVRLVAQGKVQRIGRMCYVTS